MGNADHIISVESAGPKAKARRVVFASGETLTLPNVVLRALGGIQADQNISCLELGAAAAHAAPDIARERALAIVGYRERSSTEVRQALIDEGFERHVVDAVVTRLLELALVDDARFAGMYARSRLSSGRGKRLVLRELASKGIDEETATLAVEGASDTDEVARARTAIRGAVPVDRRERERLLRRLLARGFDMATALNALDHPGDQSGE